MLSTIDKAKKQAGHVRSLADVAKDSEEDSDDDEGNEYYAGGEKRSAVARPTPVHAQSPVLYLHSLTPLLCGLQRAGGQRRSQEQGAWLRAFVEQQLSYIVFVYCLTAFSTVVL